MQKTGLMTGNDWGLHKTFEGREYMRKLFPIYSVESGLAVRKVASIIADDMSGEAGTRLDIELAQKREDDKTKSALRRWIAGSQRDLFRDAAKADRLTQRLAQLMSTEPLIEALFRTKAMTSEKLATGLAFSGFYYGPGSTDASHPKVRTLLHELQGLHEIYAPQTSGDGAWDEPITTSLSHQGKYLYFARPSGQDFLLAHLFSAPISLVTVKGRLRLSEVSSGYAYPLPTGRIEMLLADHGPPSARRHFKLYPTDLITLGIVRDDPYEPKGLPFVMRSDMTLPTTNIYLADLHTRIDDGIVLVRPSDKIKERTILQEIDRMAWDILP